MINLFNVALHIKQLDICIGVRIWTGWLEGKMQNILRLSLSFKDPASFVQLVTAFSHCLMKPSDHALRPQTSALRNELIDEHNQRFPKFRKGQTEQENPDLTRGIFFSARDCSLKFYCTCKII
jgi:hypothetical protein